MGRKDKQADRIGKAVSQFSSYLVARSVRTGLRGGPTPEDGAERSIAPRRSQMTGDHAPVHTVPPAAALPAPRRPGPPAVWTSVSSDSSVPAGEEAAAE